MDRKSTSELQEHMLWTYYGLRIGLAAIGIALPLIVLLAGGILHHVWLERSMSAYYHTKSPLGFLTTRDLFVGGLFAAAACLYLYKGFSDKENRALNLAGGFVALVAVLPTAEANSARTTVSVLHATAAVLFFLCIAYVSLFRSRDTLLLLPEARRASYARRYAWTGAAMVVSPALAVSLSLALEPSSPFRAITFWVETLGLWTFAAYWIVKTLEMRETEAEKRALDAQLERKLMPVGPPDGGHAAGQRGFTGMIGRMDGSKSGTVERVAPAEPGPH